MVLNRYLGGYHPYVTLYPAIAFVAWYFSWWESTVAMVVGMLVANYMWVIPRGSFISQRTTEQLVGDITYLFAAGALMIMGEMKHRAEQNKIRAEREVKSRLVEEERLQANLRLSGHLLRAQDEERRKIARDLHDSAGQYLAALSMVLDAARKNPESATLKLEEASDIAKACLVEIRTISQLLHPPLLDELGLAQAVRVFVEGFSARSGIRVQIDMPMELGRFGNEVEIALFRVLQESLTNVHRYSGSKTASVQIGADSEQAWLEVRDQGNSGGNRDGAPVTFREGIGITGMRERLKDRGGVLEITSNGCGTHVRATVPIASVTRRLKAPSASA
jgi:signal transduction histidine kinase